MDFLVKIPEGTQGNDDQVTISKWAVKEGDVVSQGDLLLEIETEKVNLELEAEVSGTIKEILVQEGEVVNVDSAVCSIETEDNPAEKQDDAQSGMNYFGSLLNKREEKHKVDLCILGGGPGGYVAAIKAAKSGLKVALVEKDKMGGTCLNRGCIPTKALLQSANLLSQIQKAQKFGIQVNEVKGNYSEAIKYKDGVVSTLRNGVESLLKRHNVKVFVGEGKLISDRVITTETSDAKVEISAEHIILATGSKPKMPAIQGINSREVITSDDILSLENLPKSMVVIGGGVIGMELSFILRKFGVEITVIEAMDSILPSLNKKASEVVLKSAEKQGIKVITGVLAQEIASAANGGAVVSLTKDKEELKVYGEKVLMSIGREFNIQGIDPDKNKIELTEQGAVKVDEKLRTSVTNIYAIGDVIGGYMLAHEASHEAFVAVDNILNKENSMNYNLIPSAVFSDPEVAQVGLTEKQAEDKGYTIKTSNFPYGANGKVLTTQKTEGFVELIVDKDSNRILGGTVVGVGATEIIHQIAIAVTKELLVDDICSTVFAHPTVSESVFEAALGYFGEEIHI
ncbi:dihydrolipoyl dehydrogenase [Proteinivorax tanatarense]|uniref:Dihydrolipoyl dehydrogenase n=1 Tax=Proteinivorax tanatarense TaxID=1260629 RepID=A0AAU7VKY1_9FIRM